ncbi:uncharacterized protein PRCAT00000781001 [Priceomyces carsonii]|uniref:uncharacterized protein n=1 Tax=Priceomyces carsonii TaxID=28549 RepID=UPI002ED8DBC5|nr:unnamed protein product [Priceomyces carsonii]
MSRDSNFSYVHINHPNQVLYIEKWKDEPIPFDDIDTQILFDTTLSVYPNFFFEEEDDNNLLVNSMNFGLKSLKNKRKLLKEKIWNDLNITEKFSDQLHPDNVDRTILSPLYTKHQSKNYDDFEGDEGLTIGEFMSNGFTLADNLERLQIENHDFLNFTHLNDTFLNSRSNSFSQPVLQTPRMTKTRQPSNDNNFQTPITRMTR